MEWNLQLAAAQEEIWWYSDPRRLLAETGLEISAGKMSHLWSDRPGTVRLDDLDFICVVLDREPGEPLVRDRAAGKAAAPRAPAVAAAGEPSIRLSRRGGRMAPPV